MSWKKNVSKMNGINIRHTDMHYEMKDYITRELAKIYENSDLTPMKVSKLLTENLNEHFPSGWICLIGKQFVASISH
jgi:hypothetical protein